MIKCREVLRFEERIYIDMNEAKQSEANIYFSVNERSKRSRITAGHIRNPVYSTARNISLAKQGLERVNPLDRM